MPLKICSLLPSATEMACALGLEDNLVGVSHECDYPLSVRTKPTVVHSAIDPKHHTPEEIDRLVSDTLRAGRSLYHLDLEALKTLKPDLILTQSLCEVCAPSGNETTQALAQLTYKPQVLYLTPNTIGGIWENLIELGKVTDRESEARERVREGQKRLFVVRDRAQHLPAVRAVFMEWVDPPFNGGHWVPEMIQLAGGEDPLGNPGKDSVRVAWSSIIDAQPDVLLVGPCGYNARDAGDQIQRLKNQPNWKSLPAVRQKRVYAVDANSYFARPGPRIVEGVELLAHLFHPDHFTWKGPADAFQRAV